MNYKRSKFLSFLLAFALVIVLCPTGMASAATTEYQLETPDENLSLGYSQNSYYKLGELKVTASEAFDTGYKVVVTVNRESAFKNQSADNSALAYDLVISPDMTTISSGGSFDFSAASIDAKQGLEIGTKVTADFLAAADGFYLDSLTFKASLDAVLPVKGTPFKFGKYNGADLVWRVLTVDTANKRALLVTENAVKSMVYQSAGNSNNWSTSGVKTFLNGTGDDQFLKEFTEAEKVKMLKVSIGDGDNTDSSAIINHPSGSDTVFLLSIVDANNTNYFADQASRVCKLGSSNSHWWLRSPGDIDNCAAIVDDVGDVDVYGNNVDSAHGVRPAFWLNL